jgi:ABC-type multidrug transport system fused ATPase/permease subunit
VIKLKEIYKKFLKFKAFLGKEVWFLFLASIFFGACLFIVESSFVLVLQGFLSSVGLVDPKNLILPSWYPRGLVASVVALMIFGVMRGLVYMIKFYLGGVTGQAFVKLQRQRALEFAFLRAEEVSTSQVVTVFTERVGQAGAVLQSISQLALIFSSTTLFFILGAKLAPLEMLFGIGLLFIFLIPLKFFNSRIKSAGDGLRKEWENVSHVLLQGLRNHFFFKLYGMVGQEIRKAKSSLEQYELHFKYYYKISAFKNNLPNIVGVMVISAVTYVSVRYIHTRGVILISFFYLFIRLAQGASEANAAFSELTLHWKGFKELYDWHEKLNSFKSTFVDDESDQLKEEELPLREINIEAKNLCFSYDKHKPLFQNLSFGVSKGQVLLIKGESGVGKSTLLTIVLGILRPEKGSVIINGHDVQSMKKLLSKKIAYVGPEPYMIVGTVRENLLFGHPAPHTVSDNEMTAALIRAQLSESKVELNLFVNEQAALSTGQKQRISIARAILRKPKLLILDEATANLDGYTEQNFINSIKDILNEVTTIIISHKSSFDSIATNTLVLKKGEIC